MPTLLLLAQAAPPRFPDWLQWLVVWGDPHHTVAGWFGGVMTWAKLLGLISLVCWIGARFYEGLQSPPSVRRGGRDPRLPIVAAGLGVAVFAAFLYVFEQSRVVRLPAPGGWPIAAWIGLALIAGVAIFLEWAAWSRAARSGRPGALVLLGLMHAGFVLGFVISYAFWGQFRALSGLRGPWVAGDWERVLSTGLEMGATYAGLVVLAHYTIAVLGEVSRVRWRRLHAIGWHTVVESYRRMWAPWVVLALFVVFLAFTNWFLGRARTAELARLYVGTLSLVISLLLALMIWILAPISIPNDIRNQTVYTVVSKPVRRVELIWGRLLGYMVLVSAIVLVLGGISLGYLERVVSGRIKATRNEAREALAQGRIDQARTLDEQATQLASRWSARLPLYGVLSFLDSRAQARARGIDVGMEQVKRSHIEGASPSKAIWAFGRVPDPFDPQRIVDRRIDVDRLLKPGTIEAVEDSLFRVRYEQNGEQRRRDSGELKASESREIGRRVQELDQRAQRIESDLTALRRQEQDLRRRAREAEQQGRREESVRLRGEADALHTPNIPVEMTFNVFRTTKGELGQAVRASMVVTNPHRPELAPARDLFEVHEYYTNRRSFPARMLVGSLGDLIVEVQCITPSQYLGMAEDDLYILASEGKFWANFLRGLVGLWLQALVITAVGLFAGTFLSWRVALLLTLAMIIGGQLAVGYLDQFSRGEIPGGGPFQQLIRMLTHQNLQSELDPTPAVITARAFDTFLTPLMSRLVYIVPNIAALDVSNTVAGGFTVTASQLFGLVLLGFGYALPFTAAAYFILKKREVAA
jgi:hypothetical protein